MKKEPVTSTRLKHVYSHTSVEEKLAIYKDWAASYDRETQVDLGYVGPTEAARVFAERAPDRKACILDAGCGTGQVGSALHALGYRNIHGIDFSPQMLAVAAGRGVYTSLMEGDLTRPISVRPPGLSADHLYDAAISVGLYGVGPPFAEHVHHLVNAVAPAGPAIFTVNGKGWEDKAWGQNLPAAAREHGLVLLDLFEIDYLIKENIKGKLVILTRPAAPIQGPYA